MGIGAGNVYDYVDKPLHELSIIAEEIKRIQKKNK